MSAAAPRPLAPTSTDAGPAAADSPRLVIDAGYLNGLLPPGAPDPQLSAGEWEQALLYAGLLPLVKRGGDEAPPGLNRQLVALKEALARLRATQSDGPALAEWAGALPSLGDGVVAGLAGAGLLALVLGSPLGAGAGLVGVLSIVGLRQLALWVRVGTPTQGRAAAQSEVARCVRAFLEHTWVEPVGQQLVESAPTQERLRQQLQALDRTLSRAQARLFELEGLAEDLQASNLCLGQAGEDAETRRLAAQRASLARQIEAVQEHRGRFAEQHAACDAAMERLRALARRRLLSHRVAAAIEAGGAEDALAEVEVDVIDLDARAGALGREVVDAELALKTTLEIAAAGLGR